MGAERLMMEKCCCFVYDTSSKKRLQNSLFPSLSRASSLFLTLGSPTHGNPSNLPVRERDYALSNYTFPVLCVCV